MSTPTLAQALAYGYTEEEHREMCKPVKTLRERLMEELEKAPLIVCGLYRGLDGIERRSCYVLVRSEMTREFTASEHATVKDYCEAHPEKHVKVLREGGWYFFVYPDGRKEAF